MKPELFIFFMRGYTPLFILSRYKNKYNQRTVYWYHAQYEKAIEKANKLEKGVLSTNV